MILLCRAFDTKTVTNAAYYSLLPAELVAVVGTAISSAVACINSWPSLSTPTHWSWYMAFAILLSSAEANVYHVSSELPTV